jgi:hypothetical protein
MTVKEQILLMLQEVENLLLTEAKCEGEQFAELECFEDVDVALAHLVDKVDYYLD